MAFQSIISAGLDANSVRHQETWWERDANARGYNYFQDRMSDTELITFQESRYWNRMKWYDNKFWPYALPAYNAYYFLYNIHKSN